MTYFKEWLQEASNPRHMLLVEDSQDDVRMIREHSREFNLDWTVAQNYKEAVRELTNGQKKFRLIVLDLNLRSQPDGIELFRTIKGTWPWIPVLVLSGNVDERTIEEMTRVGFVMFLKKPKSFNSNFFGELFFALSIPKKGVAGDGN